MAASIGRFGLPGGTGAQRTVRKGGPRPLHTRGSFGARPTPAMGVKALRKEDIELLREAESYMSPQEQTELRRLLEENNKLRQAVLSSAPRLPPPQLASFTAAYDQLAQRAERAGLAVDSRLRGLPADPSSPPPDGSGGGGRSSSSGVTGRGAAAVAAGAVGGSKPGRSGRSYTGASTALADPPSSAAAAAAAPPPAAHAGNGVAAPASTSSAPSSPAAPVSSRGYVREMASLSVELELDAGAEEAAGGLLDQVTGLSSAAPAPAPAPHPSSGPRYPGARFEPPQPLPPTARRSPPGAGVNSAQAALLAALGNPTPHLPPANHHNPTPAASSSSPSSSVSSSSSATSQQAPQPHQDPQQQQQDAEAARAALRAAAAAAVSAAEAAPGEAVAGREHWMVITVPERPVAGAPLRLLFNRWQSEKLRHRPRIVLQYGFNHWELQPEGADGGTEGAPGGGGGTAELAPLPGLARSETADFWGATIQVPPDSFELNFILHDSAGAYENNSGLDFTLPAEGGITFDEWIDRAAERAVARELARKEAEARAAEEARQRAHEAMLQQAEEWARGRAEELRANRGRLQEGGVTRLTRPDTGATVFRVIPASTPAPSPASSPAASDPPPAGSKILLQYNRKAGPMGRFPVPEGQPLTLVYGFNGWQAGSGGGKAAMSRVVAEGGEAGQDEDWFQAEVDLPYEAVSLNFVTNYYEHYDNNGGADFKVPVSLPPATAPEVWAQAVAERLRQAEVARREGQERAEQQRRQRAEEKKKEAQALVRAVERRKVRHVLFTSPEAVRAGGQVTLHYCPRDTPLAGRDQLFLLGGWNRWTHRRSFGPIAMQPPGEGEEHWKATIPVPKDAFKMDFVFADVPGGEGCYDNRGGFDYHLPVEGSPVREPPLHICHIAVEMAPIAKVGGLGDVVTALGRAVQEAGHQVEVLLPRYEFFSHSPLIKDQLRYETEFEWGGTRVYVTTAVVEGLRVFFIEPRNGFFNTPTVYGRYDDEVRFDFFCKASLEFLLKTGRQPDILHCHDWSTAHVAAAYWADYHPYGLSKPRVVFTIHNLNYGQKKIGEAAHACQKFTTVSPTYAYEVGGHSVIAPHVHKFAGIRNGIDPELWSPEDNPFLPLGYTPGNVVEGKKAARQALRQRLGLNGWGDKFVVAVVSRLTGQKGVPLIKHAAFRTLDRGGQFVLLGSAPDPRVQADFDALAAQMGGQDAAFCFKYDEPLSHLIYAAADMVVVPSMFEPCGLTQMIAMRYGSVPIVRHTGGLRDTVFDVDFDKERAAWELYGSSDWRRDELDATNGFAFAGTDGGALDSALNRAIDAWYSDRAWFHSLQRRVMEQDWSWSRPALDYIELYYSALKS